MMKNITQRAQNLIERDNLGTPIEVYRKNARVGSISGLILMIFGIAWALIAAAILDGFSFLLGQSSFTSVPSSSMPSIDPSMLPSISPTPSSGGDLFGIVTSAFGLIFPLVGLLIAGIGLRIFLRVILNRNNQAVVCTNGVAYVTRKSADAFRWEQVLKVFNRTSINMSAMQNEYDAMNRSTIVNHRYAVYCHDGRRFVFDSNLSHVEDLEERIEVEVARRQAMVM